ncbi:MAG: hypothetical protein ABIK73_08980 [candidate division WOR-3 bacterium]
MKEISNKNNNFEIISTYRINDFLHQFLKIAQSDPSQGQTQFVPVQSQVQTQPVDQTVEEEQPQREFSLPAQETASLIGGAIGSLPGFISGDPVVALLGGMVGAYVGKEGLRYIFNEESVNRILDTIVGKPEYPSLDLTGKDTLVGTWGIPAFGAIGGLAGYVRPTTFRTLQEKAFLHKLHSLQEMLEGKAGKKESFIVPHLMQGDTQETALALIQATDRLLKKKEIYTAFANKFIENLKSIDDVFDSNMFVGPTQASGPVIISERLFVKNPIEVVRLSLQAENGITNLSFLSTLGSVKKYLSGFLSPPRPLQDVSDVIAFYSFDSDGKLVKAFEEVYKETFVGFDAIARKVKQGGYLAERDPYSSLIIDIYNEERNVRNRIINAIDKEIIKIGDRGYTLPQAITYYAQKGTREGLLYYFKDVPITSIDEVDILMQVPQAGKVQRTLHLLYPYRDILQKLHWAQDAWESYVDDIMKDIEIIDTAAKNTRERIIPLRSFLVSPQAQKILGSNLVDNYIRRELAAKGIVIKEKISSLNYLNRLITSLGKYYDALKREHENFLYWADKYRASLNINSVDEFIRRLGGDKTVLIDLGFKFGKKKSSFSMNDVRAAILSRIKSSILEIQKLQKRFVKRIGILEEVGNTIIGVIDLSANSGQVIHKNISQEVREGLIKELGEKASEVAAGFKKQATRSVMQTISAEEAKAVASKISKQYAVPVRGVGKAQAVLPVGQQLAQASEAYREQTSLSRVFKPSRERLARGAAGLLTGILAALALETAYKTYLGIKAREVEKARERIKQNLEQFLYERS